MSLRRFFAKTRKLDAMKLDEHCSGQAVGLGKPLVLVLALAVSPGWSSAQEPSEIFLESVGVHVVNVDVVVTDRKGEPVRGLTRDDFELREGGDVVPISYFRETGAEEEVSPIERARASIEPPKPGQAQAGSKVRVHPQSVVLFIDNLHLQPTSRNRALRKLRGSLSEVLGTGDRMMIVSFERSMHVRLALTDDLEQIRVALIEAETLSTLGGQSNTERERLLARIESAKSLREAEVSVDAFAQAEYFDVQQSFEGLRQVFDLLAGLPGRKVVLHISDGLSMTAGAGLFHLLDLRLRGGGTGGFLAQRYSLRTEMLELISAANAGDVTIYTLEAAGAGASASASAARGGVNDIASYLDSEAVRLSSTQETLMLMADDTGGVPTVGTNQVTLAFDHIARDRRSTYSLGFHSAHQGDGRYYPLEVRIKKKGLEARHRSGYRNKSLETRLREEALAALRYGTGENELGMQLAVGRAVRQVSGNYLVPFTLQIPFEQLVLVPRDDIFIGRVRVIQVALDEAGERSAPEQIVLPLNVPAAHIEAALQQNVIYEAELLMESGDQRFVVGVLDELSAKTSMLRKLVRVGGP